jgi:putative lipoprotein
VPPALTAYLGARPMRRVVLAMLAFSWAGLDAGLARADDSDPWFGSDKALHFTVAAGIAGAGYGVTTALAEDRWKALAVGGGAAVAAGALKEAVDATGRGDPSWKDFTWDVLGAAVGLAIAWGIDVAVHGGKSPPLVAHLATPGEPIVPTVAPFALRF